MKKHSFLIAMILFTLHACNSRDAKFERDENIQGAPISSEEAPVSASAFKSEQKSNEKTEAGEVLSSSAARVGIADSTHKFIRTAHLKFRAKNVVQASFAIEDMVAEQGGYIEHSSIQSEVRNTYEVKCSRDSAWKVTEFVPYNQLTVRVPFAKLDQTLKNLRPHVAYLDYRTVNAENIAFEMFSNLLVQKRIAQHSSRMGKVPAKEQAQTNDQLLEREMEADRSLVENMRMQDRVNYSTIEIYMYQNKEVRKEKIPAFEEIRPYEKGFWAQLLDSIVIGWNMILALFLAIVKAWSVLLIALIVWLIIRRQMRKDKQ